MKNAPLPPRLAPLLLAIQQYRFFTARQALRRFHRGAAKRHAQVDLKELAESGYVERRPYLNPLPDLIHTGRPSYLYHVTEKGLRTLREMGYEVKRVYKPSDFEALTYYPIAHTLSVGDFLINAEVFARDTAGVELALIRHELDLQREPFHYQEQGRELTYSPDAVVDVRIRRPDGLYQEVIALELDRGTEDKPKWKTKLRAILAWKAQAYEQTFGTDVLTVAVVAARGEERKETDYGRAHRQEHLLRWTEELLTENGAKHLGAMFCFGAFDPASISPDEQFCAPIWTQPFGPRGVPLLESQKGASYAS